MRVGLIILVSTIVTFYERAVIGAEESQAYFREVSQSVSADKVRQWEEQMAEANSARAKGDISAMDVYDVQVNARKHLWYWLFTEN